MRKLLASRPIVDRNSSALRVGSRRPARRRLEFRLVRFSLEVEEEVPAAGEGKGLDSWHWLSGLGLCFLGPLTRLALSGRARLPKLMQVSAPGLPGEGQDSLHAFVGGIARGRRRLPQLAAVFHELNDARVLVLAVRPVRMMVP
jgi:hypothetical protein